MIRRLGFGARSAGPSAVGPSAGPPPRTVFGTMMRTAWLATFGYALVGAAATSVVVGALPILSFLAGVTVVALLFAVGLWALNLLLRGASHQGVAAGFAVFFLQLYVGFWLLALVRGAGWIHVTALTIGALGATLVWQAGLVTGFCAARRPVFSEVATPPLDADADRPAPSGDPGGRAAGPDVEIGPRKGQR